MLRGVRMNAVYDLSDGRRVMLYTENNRIMTLFTPFYRGNMPGVRHNDCLGKLFSIVYRGHIYYVYESFSHQILFGCLDEPRAAVVLSPSAAAAVYKRVVLREISGRLYLFFQSCAPGGGCTLEMMNPWNEEERFYLCRSDEGMDCCWYVHENQELLAVSVAGKRQAVFSWDAAEMKYYLWEQPGTAKEAQLTRQLEEAREKERQLLEQLESVKIQYEELAKTARELQRLGRLWRDKYMGK